MKIGITCYPTYGGSGAVATELGIELAKRGYEVHFISYDIPFRLNRFYRNVFFHEVEMLDYPLFKYPPYDLSLSAKMAEVVESQKLDLLHVHYAIPHSISAFLTRRILPGSEIKYITTLHGTDITLVGNHQSFFRITKFGINESDGVTCVSKYLKEATHEIFHPDKKMEVIYNFIDTEKYRRIKSPDNVDFIKKGEKVFIHISNFRPVKNILNIIKVFYETSREVNCRLLLVGDGPEVCRARALVDKLGLRLSVNFLGRQENVIPLLSIADIYMLPSENESFGLSALEALSCEVPVIGTRRGGLKELVAHGKSGYVFDPEDIDAMSTAAINLLIDRDKQNMMKFEARERAKLFDSAIIVPEYEKFYKKVLNN